MASSSKPDVSPDRIMQFAWGYAPPLIMEAAIQNGVFDAVDAGPKTVGETATATGASERGLRAIMNALVGLGLLAKSADEQYSLTPESAAFLVSSKPSYMGGFLRRASTHMVPRWLELSDIVRTGQSKVQANQETTGVEFFQGFVADLFPLSYPATQVLATDLGLDKATAPVRVLDIAAGSGVWGIGLAKRSPQVSVTAVDWAGVLDVTRNMVGKHGLTDRFTFIAGDLNTGDFGSGYNVATLGHILHSEGEQRSRALVKKVFQALAPGATIAVAEFLVNDDRTGPPNGLIFAVNMLMGTDAGDTWSFNEIAGWLKEAGFENARTLESPGPSPLILATKGK
jgi:ubiquinone/menaquinone biosynthesis C-methylase UbiE